MAHCDNCGTRMAHDLCPNCHEEAFIVETQSDYLPDYLSDDFVRAVGEQRADAKRRFTAPQEAQDE